MNTATVDAVVVGAGVIGLACARDLASRGFETIILERNENFGQETSARNSEVVHAGLHCATGSAKAGLCVAGREWLYAYCTQHRVEYRRCGKLIVATHDDQVERLVKLAEQGKANGVDDLALLSAPQARQLEPAVHCVAALLSPSTGIVDSHGFMLALLGDAEGAGAVLARRCALVAGAVQDNDFALTTGGSEPMQLRCKLLVNAAGLWAPRVAASLAGFAADHLPRSYPAKGNYFALSGRAPFSRLIYPLPERGGLGIHLTLDLGGQARFGPDVEWLESTPPQQIPEHFSTQVDAARASAFARQIRRYWPALREEALVPAYAGIRPKVNDPATSCSDFLIQGPTQHGIRGLVNLFGIESPGLTASLAIAQAAVELLLANADA